MWPGLGEKGIQPDNGGLFVKDFLVGRSAKVVNDLPKLMFFECDARRAVTLFLYARISVFSFGASNLAM